MEFEQLFVCGETIMSTLEFALALKTLPSKKNATDTGIGLISATAFDWCCCFFLNHFLCEKNTALASIMAPSR